ncbi:MlaD family protein [Gordonia sp. Z-3]|jgi:phospholipid/cholesterol/gamma-HCH transport system substrate-binding protein|uniref:MlaD family protein n=1 Tax=unclassified Gordonia (in: high G+C Gram-positive bacteria) TaxID=2657482 RepID=UPI0025804448|nr:MULTISPECIES: MlaD family protein [unclassified Gordonia (in: high G+C Gram-positive bacteria)]MED5802007.1 MlaD family protein [Gordonia sp. Z-3]
MTGSMMRQVRLLVVFATVVVAATACGFSGLNSLPVPGAQGTGSGAYQISAVLPNAAGLVSNAPVMIDDVTVGSVGDIEVRDWNAELDIRLDKGVRIPQGSHVMVGMTSVLGSTHLQIVEPDSYDGYMAPGDQIPLPACPESPNIAAPTTAPPEPDINSAQQVPGCSYPTTEQVLSSLSVVLNGGGLSQFGDVVHEMDAIFGGRQEQIRALVPRLNVLVADLNRQRGNIIRAMEGLDRMTAAINEQTPTVEKALADAPAILSLLNDQRQQFVTALDSLGRLSKTTNDVLDANSDDIETIVANLDRVLEQTAAAGPALPGSLKILLTFPFLEEAIPTIIKGDYVNSDLVLDLTFERLNNTIFRSVGAVGPEGVAGTPAGAAKRGLDPFTSPLTPGGERRPDSDEPVPAPAATPSATTPQRGSGGGN